MEAGKSFNVKEFILGTAITSSLFLIVILSPVVGFVFSLLAPLPIAFFHWRMGRVPGIAMFLLSIGLLAAVSRASVSVDNVLLACSALPIALILADDSVSYVTKFFIENDPDDEDSPSMLGFTLKSLALGLVFAAIVILFVTVFNGAVLPTAGDSEFARALGAGFAGSAVSTIVSFALTPVYLAILRRRDDQNAETSGTALSLISMVVALVVFAAVAATIAGPGVLLV